MSEWISVKDKSKKPKIGEIVVAWIFKQKEPVCVRYNEDKVGPIWMELIEVDREMDREDLITHWMPLPKLPEKNE